MPPKQSKKKQPSKKKKPTKKKGYQPKLHKKALTFAQFHELKIKQRAKYQPISILTTPTEEKGFIRVIDPEMKGRITSDIVGETSMGTSDFMSPNKVYEFMLKGYSTYSTSTSGIIDAFLPFDPSSSGYNFSEWPSLVNLFTEYKLKSFSCQFVSCYNTTTAYQFQPIAIGSNLGAIPIAPGNYGYVITQADGMFWSGQHDSSKTGYNITIHPGSLQWALTSAPATLPYSGAPGAIYIYGIGQGVSQTVFLVKVCAIYEFRVRS